ncbi:primosomal protein DnaI [Thalassobacillus sp. CUG 92003]|uniref:primosomal protein DnaI n=1 Tax=Thalassobacillus sp. CUG 92003 TaxID=2736641 RepID=UPI0015E6521A|nr:primosomal protein DnaI [Thalassobacillus sp. CUG 92003]
MEPIKSSLKKWMNDNKGFQERFNTIKEEVLASPEIKELQKQHPQLGPKAMERQLIKLHEYQDQSKKCEKCPSLDECVNILPGFAPLVSVEGEDIKLTYEKCPKKVQHDQIRKQQSLVQSLHMPKEILEATFERMDWEDPERAQAVQEVVSYMETVEEELPNRGLYLHGPFGVGKTYILGALANGLSQKNIASMIVYMPEFVREIKASIKDDTINQKVEAFKTIPILMLDDIGAESQSAWFRDEVLGSILQYRMMERLPVFFTSNYNLNELEQIFTTSNRGDVEQVKARRITERIRQVSQIIPLQGENRRG